MNYIDIILGILLLLAAIRGFKKGFIIEVASLLALVLGIWGAILFSKTMASYISATFNYQTDYLGLISFVLTFILIVVVIHILGNVLDKVVKALALGFLNQIAGLLFGVIKAALILSIILILFDKIDENAEIIPKEDKEQSRVYEPLKELVPTVLPFLNFWDEDIFEPKNEGNNQPSEIA